MDTKCIAITKTRGQPCSMSGRAEYPIRVCKTHWNPYIGLEMTRGADFAVNRFNQDNQDRQNAFEARQAAGYDRARRVAQREERRARRIDARQQEMIPIANDQAIFVYDIVQEHLNRLEEEVDRVGRLNRRQRQRHVGRLEQFVNDTQNIHTVEVVSQTKTIIERVLQIEVPEEYRWNMVNCSKTPGEIVADCRLSIHASRTMMDKYTSDDSVYEMGYGIYGRVLDCVWQFIKKSSDKVDMCNILKNELEDNVGMCQQGNLSRLANVLAGYMDGVGNQESHSEILGREFPRLWEIEDESRRVDAGNAMLDKIGVTDTRVREEWIESLY